MRIKTYMGPVSACFHSSTLENRSKDTRLIQTPIHNGQFHLSQHWNISYNFSKNSPLSTDTRIIQTLFHIIFYPLVSVLTGFHCTCNKYSCGTKRNPHCCSLRVGNEEPGSVVSLKGRYRLGNKLQQHVTTTRRSDKSLRVYWRIFVKIIISAYHEFCRSNMLQKIKLDRICATWGGNKILLQRQRFLQNFSSTHEAICHCDVSPQHVHVAATSHQTCTYWVICCRELLLQLVAYLKTCGHQCVDCCRRSTSAIKPSYLTCLINK